MSVGRSARRPRVATRPAPRKTRRTAPPVPAAELDGRERILAVAIRAFSGLGYEGATTAQIAREAGVTQPLVHHHFGSKEGLWRAAMDRVFANVPRFVPAEDGDPATTLLAGIEPFVRFVAAHPEATRIVAREGATASPRLDYLVDRYVGEPFREIVDAVRAGQRSGAVFEDVRPELVLFFILGAGSHLFDVTAFAKRSVGIDATAARTIDEFVGLVRAVLAHGLVRPSPTRNAGRR